MFVAVTAMILSHSVRLAPQKYRNIAKYLIAIGFGILCFHQAMTISYYSALNHRRSEEESYALRNIGNELAAVNDQQKPVVFVGKYTLSEDIQEMASICEDSFQWRLYSQLYTECCFQFGLLDRLAELSRKIPQTNVNSVIDWG
ncbi:MAG: hypothetical protein ACLSB9_15960 [Hydrogeniiclostridium mannosilyticum]